MAYLGSEEVGLGAGEKRVGRHGSTEVSREVVLELASNFDLTGRNAGQAGDGPSQLIAYVVNVLVCAGAHLLRHVPKRSCA